MRSVAKFTSPDASSNLTIVANTGKSGGVNLKVTMKGVGKGSERAMTGCRQTFENEADAKKAFDKLVKETGARGWTVSPTRVRNAFQDIPDAPKGKVVAKTKAA